MEYKIAELEGALLDAAVAKAMGYASAHDVPESFCGSSATDGGIEPWMPSTDWAQGGPIIEREGIALKNPFENPTAPGIWWEADMGRWIKGIGYAEMNGPTPLVAAMRTYVASKFGETIELP